MWVCIEMRQSDPPDTWDVHTQGRISRFVSTMDPLPTGRVAFTLLNCSRVRDGEGGTHHIVNECLKGSYRQRLPYNQVRVTNHRARPRQKVRNRVLKQRK